jgi:hypothetical protein
MRIVRNQDARVGMLLTHDDTYIPVLTNAYVPCKQDLAFSVGDDVDSRSKGRNRNIISRNRSSIRRMAIAVDQVIYRFHSVLAASSAVDAANCGCLLTASYHTGVLFAASAIILLIQISIR